MRADASEFAKQELIRLCHSALDSRTLRLELLSRLRKVIPFDYVYFSTTDPATQFGTNAVLLEDPPPWLMPVFLENEFLRDDFNKFSDMLRNQQRVSVLSEATGHELSRSPRYRDMLAPLGMDDELRAIFVTDAACWGTLCLHRGSSSSGYTPAEAAFAAQLSPHIADGLRKALLFENALRGETQDGPGVLILSNDLSVVAMTAAAEYWLSTLRETEGGNRHPLPLTVQSVVAGLKAIESGLLAARTMPKARVLTRSGHWLVLHASRLRSSENSAQITVTFELARPAEITPLIMQAYLLTKREREITQCVLLGWSTAEIAARLHISPNTVQDHLKAIFGKVDVSSRGELAARIYTQQYQQQFLAGTPLDEFGQFILD
jgi:DNA-binding CsgD family transcriptional regulator